MTTNLRYLTTKWKYLTQHIAWKKSPLLVMLRGGIWSIYCFLKIPKTIKLDKSGILFYLSPKFKNTGATGIYLLREDYEPELQYLQKVLAPGKVFVDAGANSGIFTLVASKLVGDSGKVLSFEPAAETYPILDHNIEINEMNNVKAFHAAIAEKPGKTRLYHINNAPNSYSLGRDDQLCSFEEVPQLTLEDVFSQEKIERFDLIKIDVEGAEELVLRGGQSLIKKMKPHIIFEMTAHGPKRLGLERNGAWNLLQEWGYDFFIMNQNGQLKSITSPRLRNIIAIPK